MTNAAVRALLRRNRGLEALNVYCCTFVSPQAFHLDAPDAAEQPAAAAARVTDARGEGEGLVLALREANLSYMRGCVAYKSCARGSKPPPQTTQAMHASSPAPH